MTYQVLARKWRPKNFADMVGQSHVLTALKNAFDSERLHHAYLFTGTRGVGKTTLARILAKCFNCEKGAGSEPCGECSTCISIDEGRFVDLIEVDAASRAKVEETRDLMDNVQYAPASGRYKIYLIDEVHMFSNHSFNALLKTLEEPPPHVKFLLATTEPKKLPVTILSRCLQFNLKHLTPDQIARQISRILEVESVQADNASIRLIAAAAYGSMRDALSLLDQAISYGNGVLREDEVREMLGTIDSAGLTVLFESLASGDAGTLLQGIDAMDQLSPDYDAVLAEFLSRLHDIAVCRALNGPVEGIDPGLAGLAEKFSPEDIQLFYQIALNGRHDLPVAPDPKTGFEMIMMRMLVFRPVESSEQGRQAVPVPAAGVAKPAGKADMPGVPEQEALGPIRDWQQLMEDLELNGLARELAGHCVLKEATENTIHLALSPAQEHLLKTVQKNRLQAAIRARFGEGIRLVVTVEKTGAETPVEQKSRAEQDRKNAAVEAFQTDPNVKKIVETFDASVDQKSIQPR